MTDLPPDTSILGLESSSTTLVNEYDFKSALSRYQQRMTSANRQFLRNRIIDINVNVTDDNETQKLNILARFWFHHSPIWPRQGKYTIQPGHEQQSFLEEAVTTIEQVANLHHPHIDGLETSGLRSKKYAALVAKAIKQVAREQYEAAFVYASDEAENDDDEYDFSIPLSTTTFLLHAQGLADPDFRHEGICGWQIGPTGPPLSIAESSNVAPAAYDDEADHLVSPYYAGALQYYRSRQIDVAGLTRYSAHEMLSDKLEMKAGFMCGQAARDDESMWDSYFIFCRYRACECGGCDGVHRNDDNDGNGYAANSGWFGGGGMLDEMRKWKWRPVSYCHSHAWVYMRMHQPLVFELVEDLLMWYAGWDERLDEGEMRRRVTACDDDGVWGGG